MRVAVQTKHPNNGHFSDPVDMVVADASPVATLLGMPYPSAYVIIGVRDGSEIRYEERKD